MGWGGGRGVGGGRERERKREFGPCRTKGVWRGEVGGDGAEEECVCVCVCVCVYCQRFYT